MHFGQYKHLHIFPTHVSSGSNDQLGPLVKAWLYASGIMPCGSHPQTTYNGQLRKCCFKSEFNVPLICPNSFGMDGAGSLPSRSLIYFPASSTSAETSVSEMPCFKFTRIRKQSTMLSSRYIPPRMRRRAGRRSCGFSSANSQASSTASFTLSKMFAEA